jgi:hypothetical protein
MHNGSQSHYEILKVGRDAPQINIARAYRQLALLYHPDRPTADAEKFLAISRAWEILQDPYKRWVYDMTMEEKSEAPGLFEAGFFSRGQILLPVAVGVKRNYKPSPDVGTRILHVGNNTRDRSFALHAKEKPANRQVPESKDFNVDNTEVFIFYGDSNVIVNNWVQLVDTKVPGTVFYNILYVSEEPGIYLHPYHQEQLNKMPFISNASAAPAIMDALIQSVNAACAEEKHGDKKSTCLMM